MWRSKNRAAFLCAGAYLGQYWGNKIKSPQPLGCKLYSGDGGIILILEQA